MKRWILAAALATAATVAACGDGGKSAAASALDAARESFDTVRADARTFVPDEEEAVEDALERAANALGRGEYAHVLSEAQTLVPKIATLRAAAVTKRGELTKAWTAMDAGLPAAVASIRARVDALSNAKTRPASVSKDALAAARTGVDVLNAAWTSANDAFRRGNLAEAVAQGHRIKSKAAEVTASLGMTVPDSLK